AHLAAGRGRRRARGARALRPGAAARDLRAAIDRQPADLRQAAVLPPLRAAVPSAAGASGADRVRRARAGRPRRLRRDRCPAGRAGGRCRPAVTRRHLPIGVQANGIRHGHADPVPDIDERFAMVRRAGVFDYIDKTPAPEEVPAFLAASERHGVPVRCGGWYYAVGRDEPLLHANLDIARVLGSTVHNVQILDRRADGRPVTDAEVVDFYERAVEAGERLGITICLEVHINMWSEDFRRVAPVGRLAE